MNAYLKSPAISAMKAWIPRHNPEFTAIETYQAYGDIDDVIDQTEQIVAACAMASYGTTKFTYEGTEIDVAGPWPRLTMAEAVKKYTGEDFDACKTIEEARAICDRLHVEYGEFDGFGKLLAAAFDDYVEEHLIQPVHITEHPMKYLRCPNWIPKTRDIPSVSSLIFMDANWQTDSPN